ncbi:MAG TPA: hypothetical protein VGE10_03455 [Zeimonas sp.]
MALLSEDFPGLLLEPREGPCLSLYQPTHRQHPDRQQDPIRFRNGVRTLEASLQREHPNREIRPLLERFHELAANDRFWNGTLDGLAVLGAPGCFRVYRLQRAVPERAVVADSFHLKPLLRIAQSADRYRILGLSRNEAKLYEGNRDVLDEAEWLEGVPRTPADVVGDERDAERSTRHYGSATGGKLTRHGTDVKQDAVDRDTERFFRAVDRGVLGEHGAHDVTPLLLAALPENHHLFRRVSRNPALASAALYAHPDSMSLDALRARALALVQPYYLERLSGLVDAFEAARSRQLASGDLSDIGAAVVAGRVATLLIDADRVVPGSFDPDTGAVCFGDLAEPGTDDLLDDLAEAVLRQGGEVVVVPSARMPVESGAAATYRY